LPGREAYAFCDCTLYDNTNVYESHFSLQANDQFFVNSLTLFVYDCVYVSLTPRYRGTMKKLGRPRLSPGVMERVVPVRLPADLWEWLEAAREARGPGRPNQSQMIRELLARALKDECPAPKRR